MHVLLANSTLRGMLNRLRHDEPACKLIEPHADYRTNYENVTRAEDEIRLRDLRDASKVLLTGHMMMGELEAFWTYRREGYALRYWQDPHGRTIRTGSRHSRPI